MTHDNDSETTAFTTETFDHQDLAGTYSGTLDHFSISSGGDS